MRSFGWWLRWVGGAALTLGCAALLMAAARPTGMAPQEQAARQTQPQPPLQAEVCRTIAAHPYDPASGLPMQAARPVPDQARCPVCGMFPARFPRWAAQLIFDDGDAYFFDSPLSLLLYLQDVPRYSKGRSLAHVTASYVQDFQTGQWLPLAHAWFVHASDAKGPMRLGNLPPFATQDQAQAFAQAHGGTVWSAAQLQQALPDSLLRQAPHRHTQL